MCALYPTPWHGGRYIRMRGVGLCIVSWAFGDACGEYSVNITHASRIFLTNHLNADER